MQKLNCEIVLYSNWDLLSFMGNIIHSSRSLLLFHSRIVLCFFVWWNCAPLDYVFGGNAILIPIHFAKRWLTMQNSSKYFRENNDVWEMLCHVSLFNFLFPSTRPSHLTSIFFSFLYVFKFCCSKAGLNHLRLWYGRKCSLAFLAPLEAILFDIDGTLCDSDPLHYYAFREMLQEVSSLSLSVSLSDTHT